ncbi:MAG: flagellar hook protein FlgE [Carboxydocellales bacterium]
MMRSLFAGVSGLKNHLIKTDVIGNNIANVNTIGFKKSRANFQDMLNQSIRGASSPQGGRGGTNPQQVGLGVTLASIDTIQTQGNLQSTGKMTDLAVQGDGFFILSNGSENVYTRAGTLDLDRNGNLINSAGLKVQGWLPDAAGTISTTSALTGLSVIVGSSMPPKATTAATFANNLDASSAIPVVGPPAVAGYTHPIIVTVYDSLGVAHAVSLALENKGANTWEVTLTNVTGVAVPGTLAPGAPVNVKFTPLGVYDPVASTAGPTVDFTPDGGANAVSVALDFTTLTQYAAETTARATDQNGNESGILRAYTIDTTGTITGAYSNGLTQTLGQVALANFSNPGGLVKEGENIFRKSNNSGEPDIGEASKGGRGSIAPGNLEMSNVDLSQEFTDMIVTQRGFQANSRTITTSDEMLQELVNLKR